MFRPMIVAPVPPRMPSAIGVLALTSPPSPPCDSRNAFSGTSHSCSCSPPIPSGWLSLWSGPATKPSSDMDMVSRNLLIETTPFLDIGKTAPSSRLREMDSSLRERRSAASNTARWEVARLRRPARAATLDVERMRFEGVVRFVLWPAVLVAGAVTAALILTSDTVDRPIGTAGLTLLVGLTWAITGMLEWRRNPTNRIGVLMMACALAWFLGRLTFTDYALPYTIGILTSPLFFAVFGHVLLAFPYGRLQSRLARGVVTVGYLDTTAVIAAAIVMFPGDVGYPDNLALVHANSGLSEALRNTARGVGIACFVVVLAILAQRWRHATPRWRRTFALV